MTGRQSLRRVAGALSIGLLAALVAAGCGSSADKDSASTAGAPAAQPGDPNAAKDAAGGTGENAAGTNAPARAPVELPPDERSIIYTGHISVEPANVNEAADAAIAAARTAGGVVGGDNRTSAGDRAEATVTLRVPSAKFGDVMTSLGKLGKELNREVKTEDVTEQVVDVQSRVATATASVDRVRALLARATTLGEIVSLESEVAKREAELESLKARLNKLTSLTALSTITAQFTRNGPVEEPKKEDDSGFLAGFKGGWDSFTASLNVLLTVVGALLPWFIMLGVPVLILVVLLRRSAARNDRAQPVPAGAAATDES
ncbi:DUF4349 domain-containing protein [Virgisporangium aurantiacum]|uniref:Lipoprotein n=1 Tax=Virgisporangium aurantiacum TaxID=175570 RepID=A0A8J3Z1L1_9ACTN|nr:DUF4349 domain-containing protein [Virgisporangium aurantiacum]GIJ53556.1 lipoprotein [Virgisporangium aurantiacum]